MLISSYSYARQIKVIVVDTGFGYTYQSQQETHLCATGHKNFSKMANVVSIKGARVPEDDSGHGTNVAGLIEKYADDSNYCMVIVKAFSENSSNSENAENSIAALEYAVSLKPDIINYSAGGSNPNSTEHSVIKEFLDNGGIFVAAAGNDGVELNENNTYYPAMYDPRIVVVGNKYADGTRHVLSNYGKLIKGWEIGVNAKALGVTRTGSSQSTAICTGKLIKLKDDNGKRSTQK